MFFWGPTKYHKEGQGTENTARDDKGVENTARDDKEVQLYNTIVRNTARDFNSNDKGVRNTTGDFNSNDKEVI